MAFANGDGEDGAVEDGGVLRRPVTFVGYRNPYLLPKIKQKISITLTTK